MKRRVQHSDLDARENQVSRATLDAIENLPVLYNLDTTPTKEQLKRVIHYLAGSPWEGLQVRMLSLQKSSSMAIQHYWLEICFTDSYTSACARRMVLHHRTWYRCCDGNGTVWWQHLWQIKHQKWCKVGIFPGTNPVWHLSSPAQAHLQLIKRRHLLPHYIWRVLKSTWHIQNY